MNPLRKKHKQPTPTKGGASIAPGLLEAAYDLGLETTILELAPHLMPVQLDLDAGKMPGPMILSFFLKINVGAF